LKKFIKKEGGTLMEYVEYIIKFTCKPF